VLRNERLLQRWMTVDTCIKDEAQDDEVETFIGIGIDTKSYILKTKTITIQRRKSNAWELERYVRLQPGQ
jgi:hypothetical protein